MLGISLVICQDEVEGLCRSFEGYSVLNIEPLNFSLSILDLLPASRYISGRGASVVELADGYGAIGAIFCWDPEVVAAGVEDDFSSLRRRP